MIPEVAVEEAAKAHCADLAQLGHPLWGDLMETGRQIRLEIMRAALAAAAPHMAADIAAELEYAPPANYEEDNYDAGYAAGLAFALDSLGAAK